MADGSKGRKVQRAQKINSRTKVCNCSICDEDIKKPSSKVTGEDAVADVKIVDSPSLCRSHCPSLHNCIQIK